MQIRGLSKTRRFGNLSILSNDQYTLVYLFRLLISIVSITLNVGYNYPIACSLLTNFLFYFLLCGLFIAYCANYLLSAMRIIFYLLCELLSLCCTKIYPKTKRIITE
jgi:predicted Abi (CAAX) family protease